MDKRIICRTCFQPIDRVFEAPYEGAPRTEWKVSGWMHPRRTDTDHEPDPISADKVPFIDQVCDFCGEPDIAWIFPTDVDKPREFHGLQLTEEAWAACQLCHNAILASSTGRELARAIADRSLPLKQVPKRLRQHFTDEVLAWQYQQFLDARSADPVTLTKYVG